MKKTPAALYGIFLALLVSCNSPDNKPLFYDEDTHSRGTATVYIEESYKPLFKTSIYTFESQFTKAHINPVYCSETEAVRALFNDSTKTICLSRDLSDHEKALLKKTLVQVRSTKIAEDAVALIVNPQNPDTSLTLQRLRDILTGRETTWRSLKTPVNVVFDNKFSGNFRYLRQFCGDAPLSKNVFAVNTNEEVINYVKNNRSALGVIGVNWISDEDDFTVLDFLKGVNVVGLADKDTSYYYKPYQGYIKTKEYPLTRDVWMINKGRNAGLNTGFVLFMAGEKGQIIIQKSALVPAVAPTRLIQISTQ